jgi:hypothetical protein
LDALLEDATPSVRDAFDLFWGALKMQMTTWDFPKVTFACSVAGVLLAVAASFVAPARYRSEVAFALMPGDGKAPIGEPAQFLANSSTQNVFSRESLTSIMEAHHLYPHERAGMPLDVKSQSELSREFSLPWMKRDVLSHLLDYQGLLG